MKWKYKILQLISQPPEFLSLSKDEGVESFHGRYVTIDNLPYALGKLIGEGDEAMVYELVRLREGYFDSVIKIPRYKPGHAKYAIWAKQVRDEINPHSDLPDVEKQEARLVKVPGGVVKVQPYLTASPETDWKSTYPAIPILSKLHQGDLEGALYVCDKLIQRYGKRGVLLEHKGIILTQMQLYEEAKLVLEEAVEAHTKEDNTARLIAAYNLANLHRILHTIEDVPGWIELKDNTCLPLPQIFTSPEEASSHVDHLDKLFSILLEILTTEPFFVPALLLMAEVLETGVHIDIFEAVITAVQRIDPTNPALPELKSGLEDWKAAIVKDVDIPEQVVNDLEKFEEVYIDPEPEKGRQAAARFQSGSYLLSMGNLDDAEHEFSAAIDLDSDNITYWLELCRVLYLKQDYEKSLRHLQEVTRRFSDESLVHFQMGEVYQKLGRHREACISFHKALACDPVEASCIELQLGHSYRAMGKLEKSIGFYKSAFQHYPNDPETILGLTYALREKSNALESEGKIAESHSTFNEALNIIQSAIQRVPNSSELYVAEAQLLVKVGRFEEAIESLRCSVSLDPKHPFAQKFLNELEMWYRKQCDSQ